MLGEGGVCEVRVECVRSPTVKDDVPLCTNHFTCRHHETVEDMEQVLAMISAVSKLFRPFLLWLIVCCSTSFCAVSSSLHFIHKSLCFFCG